MTSIQQLLEIIKDPEVFVMAVTNDGKIIIQDDDVNHAWHEETIELTLVHLPKAEQQSKNLPA